MGFAANTLIGCLLSILPGPPGLKLHNAYFQLFPVDKLNSRCPGIVPGKDVTFYLYHRLSPQIPVPLRMGDDEGLKLSGMDLGLPTILYFPPFFEGADGQSATAIREAYMKVGGRNFIVVDSKRLNAGPWYATAASNTYFVGRHAARFADYLILKGLPVEGLHFIGLSIGAHTAGIAGRFLSAGKPPRITGLDPAALIFAGRPSELTLDRSDAGFVDVVHTDDRIGLPAPIGHADFFVNGGSAPQPGCEFDRVARETKRLLYAVFCSHLLSYRLYADSVLHPRAYPGVSCATRKEAKRGRCSVPEVAYMGAGVASRARGIFHVSYGRFNASETHPASAAENVIE